MESQLLDASRTIRGAPHPPLATAVAHNGVDLRGSLVGERGDGRAVRCEAKRGSRRVLGNGREDVYIGRWVARWGEGRHPSLGSWWERLGGVVENIYAVRRNGGVSQRKEATLCLVRQRTGRAKSGQRMLISARGEAEEGGSMDDGGRVQCWR